MCSNGLEQVKHPIQPQIVIPPLKVALSLTRRKSEGQGRPFHHRIFLPRKKKQHRGRPDAKGSGGSELFMTFQLWSKLTTLPETNSKNPWKLAIPKGTFSFQPWICRGYAGFREGIVLVVGFVYFINHSKKKTIRLQWSSWHLWWPENRDR